jgi:hypothetical protein
LVAQSWDGETIGEFNLKTNQGWFGKKGIAEGLDPNKRARLDDLIDQYRTATDPEAYYGLDGEYGDPDEIIAQIRQEFGDNVANKVEAGADKMHFPRQHHTHGYDPMSWKEPVDRITKGGKMYKQDSDFRKNTIKSRYKLGGKSATEGVAEGAVKTLSMDLQSMSDKEFFAKYKKTKIEARAGLKGLSEERTETKNEKGEVTSWKDESDWHKGGKNKDGRGKVTNLSDKARRETEKLTKKQDVSEESKGLWANIHAKRERGERMRKPGSKGAPTKDAFKKAAK